MGRPSPADVSAPDACVYPVHLTEPFLATLTVLAALYRIFLFLSGYTKGYSLPGMVKAHRQTLWSLGPRASWLAGTATRMEDCEKTSSRGRRVCAR